MATEPASRVGCPVCFGTSLTTLPNCLGTIDHICPYVASRLAYEAEGRPVPETHFAAYWLSR